MPTKTSSLELKHVKTAMKQITNLSEGEHTVESMLHTFHEHISGLSEKMIPSCYLDILYEITKSTPVVELFLTNSSVFLAVLKS